MATNEGWYSSWFANGWFPAVWFAPADEEEEETIGGGGIYRPDWPSWRKQTTYRKSSYDRKDAGVTREMLKPISDRILAVLEQKEVPVKVKKQVKKAVKSFKKMKESDELSTLLAESARSDVEQAWMALQSKKVQLETKLPLLEIKWLLTLQHELSILYAMIDDEEAALVLLMSV